MLLPLILVRSCSGFSILPTIHQHPWTVLSDMLLRQQEQAERPMSLLRDQICVQSTRARFLRLQSHVMLCRHVVQLAHDAFALRLYHPRERQLVVVCLSGAKQDQSLQVRTIVLLVHLVLCLVVWLFIGTQKKVSGPPLCPSRLTKRWTYRPCSVIYRYVSRQSSEK